MTCGLTGHWVVITAPKQRVLEHTCLDKKLIIKGEEFKLNLPSYIAEENSSDVN